MNNQKKTLHQDGSRLLLIGVILIILSLFGVIPYIVNIFLKTILNNPVPNTTGLAIVNIGTLSSALIGLIAGMCLIILDIRRKHLRNKQN